MDGIVGEPAQLGRLLQFCDPDKHLQDKRDKLSIMQN